MKVCIIGHMERNYMPYIERYVDYFTEHSVECDIICWQREQEVVSTKNELNFFYKPNDSILGKLVGYLNFKSYVRKIIRKNKYDKVVVLTSVMGYFLTSLLNGRYKNKYLFDIRDYSYEHISKYKKTIDKLVSNSQITTISSKGFMEFLEKNDKIIVNHNMPSTKSEFEPVNIKEKAVINIGYIGGVRYFDENKAFISSMKNTFQYQLWYIGQVAKGCDLKKYATQHGITNVSFVGKYENTKKIELYKGIDMINSIYGDNSIEVTTALPNRLYEACLYYKPIIASKGTYLGEIILKYDLGLVVDVKHDDVLSMVNSYVKHFDLEKFVQGCKNFLADVQKDEVVFYNRLAAFIRHTESFVPVQNPLLTINQTAEVESVEATETASVDEVSQ